nr:hypothetical protein [Cytophagaceae bacterium]
TAIHYLNDAYANASDDALRNHELSEAVAFIEGLKYNPTKVISDNSLSTILNLFKSGGEYDFYNISLTNIQSARDQLSEIYGLNSVKNNL